MSKIPATVRILTLNSAKTLQRALDSVKDFDEILVFDGNSTDDTVKIAREYGARVEKQFPDRNEPNIIIHDWPEIVNRITKTATYDWIFYIDSDEAASEGLVREIRNVVDDPSPKHYVYRVPNKVIYKGRLVKHAISYPGYQNRFFNRKADAHFEDNPHYLLVFDRNKYSFGTFENPWYVFIDESDVRLKVNFIKLTALKDKDQNWWQFLRWSIFNKLFGIVKICIKAFYVYARYGLKESIPPMFVVIKITEKILLFLYLIKQRFISPLKVPQTQKNT